ncbi:MAG: hypothetical protein QOH53_1353 [Ilumatobacteraceae bacterium]
MTACTISIDSTDAAVTLYRTVLASLPNSYRIVDADAEVVLLSATGSARIEQVCAGGTRALVIDRPGRLSSHHLVAIAAAADRLDCIVVPAVLYAPRADAAAELLGSAHVDLLESTIISPATLRTSLVEQLALLRTVLGPVAAVRVAHASVSHYVLEAALADHPQCHVLLNGVSLPNAVDEATLQAIGPERRVAIRIDAGPLARPAEIHCYHRAGGTSPWPLHQHAHRLTLARLHRLLTTAEGDLGYSLNDLRHDVQLAEALPG